MELFEEAAFYQTAALASSTRKQYDAHARYFLQFCAYLGLDSTQPTEPVVCCYAAYLARTVAPTTVRQYLKGARDYYKDIGYDDFASPTKWRALYKTLKGIDRTKQSAGNKKQPITPAMLLKFRQTLDLSRPSHAAIWACVTTAFFTFMRKSNVSTQSSSMHSDGKCLRACDIVLDYADHTIAVTAPGSKTRQFGAAPTVHVQGMRNHGLDPFEALANHFAVNGKPASAMGPAFCYTEHGKVKSITHAEVVAAAKRMAELMGVLPSTVAGHSFRRGGATWAFMCGVPEVLVQRQGDWRSQQYREYIELSKATALACTAKMFEGMGKFVEVMRASDEPAGHVPGGELACVMAW